MYYGIDGSSLLSESASILSKLSEKDRLLIKKNLRLIICYERIHPKVTKKFSLLNLLYQILPIGISQPENLLFEPKMSLEKYNNLSNVLTNSEDVRTYTPPRAGGSLTPNPNVTRMIPRPLSRALSSNKSYINSHLCEEG